MTPDMIMVLFVLAAAMVFFVTEWLRVDLVALLVLTTLSITGMIAPLDALSGFSSPAVVTVWAVFILSGGLSRTGVARIVGRRILKMAGKGEGSLIAAIMLTAAMLSAFMNNVGVAALLLPVVVEIARRTNRPPSKLLIPLAYSCLLGGLTTLIGTPPNILVAGALRELGLSPFRIFDFTPVGLAVLLAGVAFMTTIGRRLLPARDLTAGGSHYGDDLRRLYRLNERMFILQIPPDSVLDGQTLADSHLGSALGLNVIGISRDDRTQLAPDASTVLKSGDRLLVEGVPEKLIQLQNRSYLIFDKDALSVHRMDSVDIFTAAIRLNAGSELIGKTLRQIDFRRRFGVHVLSIRRGEAPLLGDVADIPLQGSDILQVQGIRTALDALKDQPDFELLSSEAAEVYGIEESFMAVAVPDNSPLAGRTLAESGLHEAFEITVLAIIRQDQIHRMPGPHEPLVAGDTLLVEGDPEDLLAIRGLQSLYVEPGTKTHEDELESERIGFSEVVLSPRTALAGKTLRQLHFREKYGLNVVAICREGQVYRSNLGDRALRFGDALLVHGPREKLTVLGSEPDFLVLREEAQEPPRLHKAPIAASLMVGVVLASIVGWLPIYISAITGAALMVVTGCLTMDEAYRAISWRAVFLIAGMLPMGIAMEESGAASLLTKVMVDMVGWMGPRAVLAGFYAVTALSAQIMPTSAVAILIAPIAYQTAQDLGISPYALMMTVALSASASFMSPVAHPANVLIMGPGSYRFADYIKVGLPLTLVCFLVVVIVLPLVWPL